MEYQRFFLRGFELTSGLNVNFLKSKHFGLNVKDPLLQAALSFLHCSVGLLPFTFLGILIGVNPIRKGTWNSILDKFQRRLAAWRGKKLSFCYRILFINSVLNGFAVHFFSFFKVLKLVINEIIKYQSSFLWGGMEGRSKTTWLS